MNVGLVVSNTAALTSGDTWVQSRLQGLGHTVTALNRSSPGTLTAFEGLVFGPSVPTTYSTSFNTTKLPILSCGNEPHPDYTSASAIGASAALTNVYIPVANDPYGILSGLVTQNTNIALFSTSDAVRYYNITQYGAGTLHLGHQSSSSNPLRSWLNVTEEGDDMFVGTAPGRRAMFSISDAAFAKLTTLGGQMFDRMVAWSLSPPWRARMFSPTTGQWTRCPASMYDTSQSQWAERLVSVT